ncbi:MAG: M14 family metallocarboxypeptidase [Verrucomicrobiales bacterium]|nr:M14 family metallocarboxypeptidase [Verrucomicrobiales bacterium]
MSRSTFTMKHSGHDYVALVDRWLRLCKELSLSLEEIERVNDFPVLAIETACPSAGVRPIYLSAGVHGDECAPVWGLLNWAEQNREILRSGSFQIFPCLNPVGLIENTRRDGDGIDLNRNFENLSIPVIAAWHRKLADRRYRATLNLHEDYDATGIYLYEIAENPGLGRTLLSFCETTIPCDPGPEIDGQAFVNGLCHHDGKDVREVVEKELGGGYPEAIYLKLNHTGCALTFETPSELDLGIRIEAHQRAVEALVSHAP